MSNLNNEKRLVILTPFIVGFAYPYLSYVFDLYAVSNTSTNIHVLTDLSKVYKPIYIFKIMPFFALTMYLSMFVELGGRREAYGALFGGLISIFCIYLITSIGNGSDPFSYVISDLFAPFIAFAALIIGIQLGKRIARNTLSHENKP